MQLQKWDYNPQTRRREKIGMEERTVEAASMFDVNKAIMRCLVKNLAMFGLGLYVYAGEDLPEDAAPQPEAEPQQQPKPKLHRNDCVHWLPPVRIFQKSSAGLSTEYRNHCRLPSHRLFHPLSLVFAHRGCALWYEVFSYAEVVVEFGLRLQPVATLCTMERH